jgi:hypothetical protein
VPGTAEKKLDVTQLEIAVLGGGTLLVFTGGIGENDAEVRAGICGRLESIGVLLEDPRNRAASDPISGQGSGFQVRVLPSQEVAEIASQTWALCRYNIPGGAANSSALNFIGIGLGGLTYGHRSAQLLPFRMASICR